jgi:hypothetical protein
MWQPAGGIRAILIRTTVLLCLLEVAYVAGANAVLTSSWARSAVNRKPDKVRLEWTRAWTWFPGVVHVRGLTIRAQTRRVQWYSTTERVRVALDLFPLTLRHFRASSVHGEGVTFLLRRRLDTLPGPAIAPETWPEIPGLDNPPSRPPDPPGDKPRWKITIDDSRLDRVKTIWIDSVRFEGEGRAEGKLRAAIGKEVTIDHASLRMPKASFVVAEKTVVSEGALDIVVAIDTFAPRGTTFRKLWPRMTGELRCAGPVSTYQFLDLFLRRAEWLGIDGSGPLDFRLVFRRGDLLPGSRVEAGPGTVAVRVLAHEVRGEGRIHGEVEEGSPPTVRLGVAMGDFALSRGGAAAPYVRGTGFDLLAVSEDNDFREGMPELRLTLELPESRVSRFEVFGDYLPQATGFRLESGSGELQGKVELWTRTMTGTGQISLEGTGVRGSFEGLPVRGDVAVGLHLAPLEGPDTGRETPAFALPSARLAFTNVVTGEDPAKRTWSGSVELGDGAVASKPLVVSGSFTARLQDTRPILALVAERSRWVSLCEPFLTLTEVEASGRLRLDEATVSIDDFDMRAEEAEMRADLAFAKSGKSGLLYARRRLIRFAVEIAPAGNTWKIAGARKWFEKRRAERGANGES